MSKRLTNEKAMHLGQHVLANKDDYDGKEIEKTAKACSLALGFEVNEEQVLTAAKAAQVKLVVPTKEEKKAKKPTVFDVLARIEGKIDLLLGDKP